ncbi:MAG: hypothetical protein ABSG53_28690 [Thermoguttaceae bacterium]
MQRICSAAPWATDAITINNISCIKVLRGMVSRRSMSVFHCTYRPADTGIKSNMSPTVRNSRSPTRHCVKPSPRCKRNPAANLVAVDAGHRVAAGLALS